MYFEETVKRISPTLKGITHRLNGHFTFFSDEDLFQEALVFLWVNFENGKLTDKTDSYILQGCYFYLRNYLRKTLDKTRLLSLDSFAEEGGVALDDALCLKTPVSTYGLLHARSVLSALKEKGLTKREEEVLSLFLEGLNTREIGSRLGISHVMVVKVKKIIKCKLSCLEVA